MKRTGSFGPDEMVQRIASNARDYVMSLHQSYKTTLLYGKNNVTVQPVKKNNSESFYYNFFFFNNGGVF